MNRKKWSLLLCGMTLPGCFSWAAEDFASPETRYLWEITAHFRQDVSVNPGGIGPESGTGKYTNLGECTSVVTTFMDSSYPFRNIYLLRYLNHVTPADWKNATGYHIYMACDKPELKGIRIGVVDTNKTSFTRSIDLTGKFQKFTLIFKDLRSDQRGGKETSLNPEQINALAFTLPGGINGTVYIQGFSLIK